MFVISRRTLPLLSGAALPHQANLAMSQTSFLLGTPFRLSSSDNKNIMQQKPDGIGMSRWNQIKKELVGRAIEQQRTTSAIKRHQRELEEKLSNQLNKVQSIWDKIDDVEVQKDGKVVSNYIMEKKKGESDAIRRFQFDSVKDFETWKEKNKKAYLKSLKGRITPHEFYITQGKGMERAFTGDYWWTNDIGRYECKCCKQRLFMWDHKFINKSGYPTFWNCLQNAVKFVDDAIKVNKVTNAHECPTLKGKEPVKRAVCSNVSH